MRPWDYQVCAAIPVFGSPEAVKVCIDTLRCQTERPCIVLVDTGSNSDDFAEIEAMRADDCEVHAIRTRATIHPHDNVASAMDLAFSLCRSPFLFATHADCFLKRRELLAEMVELCKSKSPIVGYGMSPRNFPAHRWMVSHVCTMFDMKVMDRINAGWCQRRLVVQEGDGKTRVHEPIRGGWPDTDLFWNYQAKAAGITPYRIGREPRADTSFEDHNIEHSRGGGNVQGNGELITRLGAAVERARERLREWNVPNTELAGPIRDNVRVKPASLVRDAGPDVVLPRPIAVVIPAAGSPDLTSRCLDHLCWYADVPFDVIYVDNGGTPDVAERVASHAERLGLDLVTIHNSTNRGFTAAVNQGIRAAAGRHVLLLNNDCFIGPGCLMRMLSHLQTDRVAAVGPFTSDGGIQSLHRQKNVNMACVGKDLELDDSLTTALALTENAGRSKAITRLAFFCTLLSADAIDEIGDLDERFANLGSDDDWCVRAQTAGWQVRIALDAYACHIHKATFERLGFDRRQMQLRAEAAKRKSSTWRCILAVPVFNRLEYVRQSLESIIEQDYPALRTIVWDNGSDDETRVYLEQRLANVPHVTLIRAPVNMGCVYPQSVIWNRYAHQAELLAKLDSDMIVPPDCISRLAAACQVSDRLGFMGAFHFRADGEQWINPDRIVNEGKLSFVKQQHVGGCGMIRADVYRATGPIKVPLNASKKPFADGSFTIYQLALNEAGYLNGYPSPLIHIDQMEDTRSSHSIETPEYIAYKVEMRGRTPAQVTQYSWIKNAKRNLG